MVAQLVPVPYLHRVSQSLRSPRSHSNRGCWCHGKLSPILQFVAEKRKYFLKTRVYLDRPFLFPECDDIGYYRDNIKLESITVYLDRPFLFPECDDIGYYRDNIKLESTRVYLDGSFLFPECDDIGYYHNNIMYDSIRAKYQIISIIVG